MLMSVALDQSKAAFHVGILPLPNFTLLAFAAFIDTLRLAADEGDLSRPLNCRWTIVAPTLAPVRASCGSDVSPWEALGDPTRFDYIAVVGGLWNSAEQTDCDVISFIRAAAAASVKLIGLGVGTFALVRAGVMQDRRPCISAYHAYDFVEAFPTLAPITDQWFVVDRDRITSPGGVAAADVAAYLVRKHCGDPWARKALHMSMIPRATPANHPQPISSTSRPLSNDRLQRAVSLLELRLCDPPDTGELAAYAHLSARQLQRLFKAKFGCGPHEFSRQIRLRHALWLLKKSNRTVADIADTCGFRQTSHFCRQFKAHFGSSPLQARMASAHDPEAGLQNDVSALPLGPEPDVHILRPLSRRSFERS